ncbi:MAG: hypoxanthine phosphoribosyltransferase [Candidatus Gastranaerophilales bacterium]|nr:hypoxanthine phosphoribosyltransferase [Candidatus Gastranaerophilales bacterium]
MNALLDKPITDLKVLISEETLQTRLKELGKYVDNEFKDAQELIVICVLKGAVMFCCDFAKHISIPLQMEFIRISSYGNDSHSSNHLKAIDLTLPMMKDKNVLIVEDIVDTGLTAKFLIDLIQMEHAPKKLRFVSLLNKTCARKIDINPDIAGFEIDNKFVVGYGLDYKGYYRNLPYIGYFPQ